MSEKGAEIDELNQMIFKLEKHIDDDLVRSTTEASCLQGTIKEKEEEIRHLKAQMAQLRRDSDQKLQQARMKYEEHLLSVTTKTCP